MLLCDGGKLVLPDDVLDLDLEDVAVREVVGERGVLLDVAQVDGAAASLHLHVVVLGDRVDDPEQGREAERLGHLLTSGADELLLPREPVEIGVGVPEADEVERLLARQVLVARLQVDVRVVGLGGADVLVVVAPVDVEPDPAELVHDPDEAEEVDRDQVVDRHVRQVPHGLERAAEAAVGVGAVDPARPLCDGRTAALAGAVERDLEVARERQHRDRVRDRVGPDQHHRVRARGRAAVAGAVVVPEHERGRGRLRRVEPGLGLLALGRGRPEQGHALVRPEVEAAHDADHDHREHRPGPEEEAAHARGDPALRRRRLPVEGHRRQRAGRQNRMPVAVDRGPAADPSFERCPHEKRERRQAFAASQDSRRSGRLLRF